MKKSFFKKAISLFIALTVCISLVACAGGSSNNGKTTVLKIYAHAGGPGIDYFNMPSSSYGGKSMVQAFEEKYANVSFEPGKMGVTVKVDALSSGKEDAITAAISSGNGADVYYTWGRFEQSMAQKGLYKNITDLMTEKVYTADGELAEGTYDPTTKKYTWTGEQPTLSILDKMTAHVDDLYLQDTGSLYKEGSGYYAIPYEDSLVGFIVDYDLFKEKGWNDYDGVDGLPDTMDDFFDLIERITDAGMFPFTTCENTASYWNSFGNAFILQYEGEQAKAGWTYSGDVTFPAGTFDGTDYVTSEGMTTNSDGSYTITITPRNAWLLNYLPGVSKYINFVRAVFKENNINRQAFTDTTYDYISCQYTFITSNQQRGLNDTRIAMIFEGEWWENESKDKFSKTNGGAYGTRDFRMMTIPLIEGQKDKSVRSVASTMNGDNLFINAKSNKYEVARLWLQFTHSESGLETYNMLTGLGRCFNYTLSDEQFSSMTKFAQQCYKLRNSKDEYSKVKVVYPEFIGEGHDYYKYNPLGGIGGEYSFYSSAIDGDYDQLAAFFRKHIDVSAKDFIDGMKAYNSKAKWESDYDTWYKMQNN